jgi:hypothetical protein
VTPRRAPTHGNRWLSCRRRLASLEAIQLRQCQVPYNQVCSAATSARRRLLGAILGVRLKQDSIQKSRAYILSDSCHSRNITLLIALHLASHLVSHVRRPKGDSYDCKDVFTHSIKPSKKIWTKSLIVEPTRASTVYSEPAWKCPYPLKLDICPICGFENETL